MQRKTYQLDRSQLVLRDAAAIARDRKEEFAGGSHHPTLSAGALVHSRGW